MEKAGEVAWNSGGPYTIRPRIQCSMKSPKGSEEVTKWKQSFGKTDLIELFTMVLGGRLKLCNLLIERIQKMKENHRCGWSNITICFSFWFSTKKSEFELAKNNVDLVCCGNHMEERMGSLEGLSHSLPLGKLVHFPGSFLFRTCFSVFMKATHRTRKYSKEQRLRPQKFLLSYHILNKKDLWEA